MALFPTQVFTKDNVSTAWKASYTSENINKKFNGIPRGVYFGFDPAPNAGDPVNILDLNIDLTEGASLLRARSGVAPVTVDLQTTEVVELNFSGHVVFPVYVVGKVSYQVGAATTAEIVTQTTPPNGVDEIGICKINSLPLNGAGAIDADPENAPDRHAPIANTGVVFGFMTSGAEQDRQRAVATSDEVDAARVDMLSVTHPDLATRLAADFSLGQLGDRLAKALDMVRSRIYTGVVDSANRVSGDFADVERQTAATRPYVTIDGNGSESSPGVISSPGDSLRNKLIVQNATTRRRFLDELTGQPVFGRLAYEDASFGAITLTFTPFNTTVTASANVSGIVEIGDIISDDLGRYYLVTNLTGGTVITINTGYQSGVAPGPQANMTRRRFTVTLRKLSSSGVETDYEVVRAALLDSAITGGNEAFEAGETITYTDNSGVGGATATVVRLAPSVAGGGNKVYYIPTDTSRIVGDNSTITQTTGAGSGATASAANVPNPAGPNDPAPDLLFYYPVFSELGVERYSALGELLHSFSLFDRLASELFPGPVILAPDGGTDAETVIQASDSRLVGTVGTPGPANRFVTETDPVADPLIRQCVEATGFASFSSTSTVGGVGAPVHTNAVWALQSKDDGGTQIATVDADGIITLERPPAGIIYNYTFHFTFQKPNNQGMDYRLTEKNGSPLVTMNDPSVNTVNSQKHMGAMVWAVAVDDAGPLVNEYELQVAGAHAADVLQNKMVITRTARLA